MSFEEIIWPRFTGSRSSSRRHKVPRLYGYSKGHDRMMALLICFAVEECPLGYPRLAAFLSSDQNFMVYRGFDYLHSRVLLHHQNELAVLEQELDELDDMDQANSSHDTGIGEATRLQSIAIDKRIAYQEKQDRSRQQILSDIRTKLLEYGPYYTRHCIVTFA